MVVAMRVQYRTVSLCTLHDKAQSDFRNATLSDKLLRDTIDHGTMRAHCDNELRPGTAQSHIVHNNCNLSAQATPVKDAQSRPLRVGWRTSNSSTVVHKLWEKKKVENNARAHHTVSPTLSQSR